MNLVCGMYGKLHTMLVAILEAYTERVGIQFSQSLTARSMRKMVHQYNGAMYSNL